MTTKWFSRSAIVSCTICVFLVFLITGLVPAHAYVDPGSGSVIVTTLLGIFAAIGYTFRKYFYKLCRMLKRNNKKDDKGEDKNKIE
ncbi:MAG: hypothetical protein ACI8P9_005146 [Parasphingorhabdus sp.]|jgi:hypothetical protein